MRLISVRGFTCASDATSLVALSAHTLEAARNVETVGISVAVVLVESTLINIWARTQGNQ